MRRYPRCYVEAPVTQPARRLPPELAQANVSLDLVPRARMARLVPLNFVSERRLPHGASITHNAPVGELRTEYSLREPCVTPVG
jgi:hypothetical protein